MTKQMDDVIELIEVLGAIAMFGLLFISSPIWCLPYLAYKRYNNLKQEIK